MSCRSRKKTWGLSRLCLVLSQIQCFPPPFFDGVLSYYSPFTQTSFVQPSNSTVTKLRTCRSFHLSYYLCTVAINAVFFFAFLSDNLRLWISKGKSVALPEKGTETNDRNRNLTIDIIYILTVSYNGFLFELAWLLWKLIYSAYEIFTM